MALLEPQLAELPEKEDVGYFFSYRGGLQLVGGSPGSQAPGNCSTVAACSRHGLVFWSNLSGEDL